MSEFGIHRLSYDCFVVEQPRHKYKYMADLDSDRKVECEVWIDQSDTQTVHAKFVYIPPRGFWGRLKNPSERLYLLCEASIGSTI